MYCREYPDIQKRARYLPNLATRPPGCCLPRRPSRCSIPISIFHSHGTLEEHQSRVVFRLTKALIYMIACHRHNSKGSKHLYLILNYIIYVPAHASISSQQAARSCLVGGTPLYQIFYGSVNPVNPAFNPKLREALQMSN